MTFKIGVFIALIYFTFLLCKCDILIKSNKIYYNAEISCNSTKKFDCKLNNSSFCVDVKYGECENKFINY